MPEQDLSLSHTGETRPINEIIISKLDMRMVQIMITASHSRDLTTEERVEMRKILDRWQNALTLADHITVRF